MQLDRCSARRSGMSLDRRCPEICSNKSSLAQKQPDVLSLRILPPECLRAQGVREPVKLSYVAGRISIKRTVPKTQNSPSGAVGIPSLRSTSAWCPASLAVIIVAVIRWVGFEFESLEVSNSYGKCTCASAPLAALQHVDSS